MNFPPTHILYNNPLAEFNMDKAFFTIWYLSNVYSTLSKELFRIQNYRERPVIHQ